MALQVITPKVKTATVKSKCTLPFALFFALTATNHALAQLPEPVQAALTRTNLNETDISLIIAPVVTNDIHTQVDKPALLANLSAQNLLAWQEDADSKLTNFAAQNNTVLLPLKRPVMHLPTVQRTPASTMKLIPTFIALNTLGANFVWQTRVYYSGFIHANQLYGDLIIQGSGDPKLTHQRLLQLLYQVQQAGIKHIRGDIIIDSSVFTKVSKDPAAFDNAPLRPYNASPDGFLVNFSSLEVQSVPIQHDLTKLFYKPKLADIHLPDYVPLRASRYCRTIDKALAPIWQQRQLIFTKALPTACKAHLFYLAYPNAKTFAVNVVKQQWYDLGGTLTGNVRNQEKQVELPVSALPLVSYPSLPLKQQIYDINHYSNNVMTEQVTLSLPLYKQAKIHQSTHKASNANHSKAKAAIPHSNQHVNSVYFLQSQSNYHKALGFINQWWQMHLNTPPPQLTNGSGLCRQCQVSAQNLAELLAYAYQQPDFEIFVNSLSIAGINGTVATHKNRLPHSQAIGRAWIKTGTLDNVTAMAGYVHGLSGQDYVVVGIINSDDKLNTYGARQALDQMLDWTAKH